MCCAFISKKHLALLVAGCFFFLFAFICLSIPVVRIGLFSNESVVKNDSPVRVYCPLISGCSLTPSVKNMSAKNKSLLPSNIGLFSNPVSVSAHKQRAPGPFCGAKLFLSILPLFLPVVNLNEHPEKPLVISFRRKMHLFIQFESYELQFLIDFSKVPGAFTVTFRCKVHLILLSPPHRYHIHHIFCHSSFL